jgi:hypothetical protein
MPVKESEDSPSGHAVAEGAAPEGTAMAASAGAAATATANPPARTKRRTEISRVAIIMLSVVERSDKNDTLIKVFAPAKNE